MVVPIFRNFSNMLMQHFHQAIRLYDTEAENEAAEWQHGEGQMEGEYFDD